jgi:predicted phosphoribosyltransferase/dienelactone hydrolase
LRADLVVPKGATGLILFAHGSGSSRLSPRNRFVAQELQAAGFGTVLLDLLTVSEEIHDESSGRFRFDIDLLAERLAGASQWLARRDELRDLPVGYFGASTGAAAALVAAARYPGRVHAVVSRGGRPDLARRELEQVEAPTQLIVGEADQQVLKLNIGALRLMHCEKKLTVVPGATHLFEEPGALEQVARLARAWFADHLAAPSRTARGANHRVSSEPRVPFSDRRDAGSWLARELRKRGYHHPIVLGIPRGGVVVAAEVARELGAELGAVTARKLRASFQPELAIGAVTADGTVYIDPDTAEDGDISREYLQKEIARRSEEAHERDERFTQGRPTSLKGRTIIVVDDGLATGATAIAALRSIRRRGAAKVVLAAPAGSPRSVEKLRTEADEVICLSQEPDFFAVSQYYVDFGQVEDDEVARILGSYQRGATALFADSI